MKGNFCFYMLLGIVSALLISSCNNHREPRTAYMAAEDSMKIKAWDKLFGASNIDNSNEAFDKDTSIEKRAAFEFKSRAVTNLYVKDCIKAYKEYFENLDKRSLQELQDFKDTKYSFQVLFNKDGSNAVGIGHRLNVWLNNLSGDFTDFAFCFGIYVKPDSTDSQGRRLYHFNPDPTTNALIVQHLKTKEGRMTIFIRPKYYRRVGGSLVLDQVRTDALDADSSFNLGEINPPPGN